MGPWGPLSGGVTDLLRPAVEGLGGLARPVLLAVCVQLRLRIERGAEALQRAEQRGDLVQRVHARRLRVHLEPERDLVRAVGDSQPDARLGRSAPPLAECRVLDEHAHVGAAVEARQVETELLVDADTPNARVPRRVRGQVRHGRPPFETPGRTKPRSWGEDRVETRGLLGGGSLASLAPLVEVTDPLRPAVRRESAAVVVVTAELLSR